MLLRFSFDCQQQDWHICILTCFEFCSHLVHFDWGHYKQVISLNRLTFNCSFLFKGVVDKNMTFTVSLCGVLVLENPDFVPEILFEKRL